VAVGVVPAPAAAPSVPERVVPVPVSLERAVARRLRDQFGQRADLRRLARQAIMRGEVVVDGDVCRDPGRLVDPAGWE
jgi:hypothetical protein